jgi:hypothetical protein
MEKKIYRKDDNGEWGNYSKVIFPDGQVMDEDSHDFDRDGFFWSDEPPLEYVEWLDAQNTETL